MPKLTNATKANIIAVVNAALALLASFGWLSDAQTAAVVTFVNALAVLWVGLTYKDSPKRVPDTSA